jgi:pilus assembly protein Flp/PilA
MRHRIVRRLKECARDQRGQSLVEYALILVLVAVVAVVALTALGGGLQHVFQNITGQLDQAGQPTPR